LKSLRIIAFLVAVSALGIAVMACGQLGTAVKPEPTWVPGPVTASTRAGALPEVEPTSGPTAEMATVVPAPVIPLATESPTTDPHIIVITDSDITSAMAAGAGGDSGLTAENLAVRFNGGKTKITAGRVSYSMLSLDNLALSGQLVARDGALQMDVESVSPQGAVGAMIPGIVNQALKRYTSQWYVEDVQTRTGQVQLRVR
jgi:hypothetical protein